MITVKHAMVRAVIGTYGKMKAENMKSGVNVKPVVRTHVDNPPKPLPLLSLCTGYGGLELGVRAVVPHARAIACVEREAYAVANLAGAMEAGAMDPCPIWTDLRTFPWYECRHRVAGLLAGYPCQPESAAGARQGKADDRWLWPYIRHAVAIVRPSWCFFENVAGHVSRGLADVLQDLGGMDYICTAGIFSAAEVGAPHLRKRVFIFAADPNGSWQRQLGRFVASGRRRPEHGSAEDAANANGKRCGPRGGGEPKRSREETLGNSPPSPDSNSNVLRISARRRKPGTGASLDRADGAHRDVTNTQGAGLSQRRELECESRPAGACDGSPGSPWRSTQSPLCRGDDAPANRIDQLRLCGNGVVPAQAALAFRSLVGELLGGP